MICGIVLVLSWEEIILFGWIYSIHGEFGSLVIWVLVGFVDSIFLIPKDSFGCSFKKKPLTRPSVPSCLIIGAFSIENLESSRDQVSLDVNPYFIRVYFEDLVQTR